MKNKDLVQKHKEADKNEASSNADIAVCCFDLEEVDYQTDHDGPVYKVDLFQMLRCKNPTLLQSISVSYVMTVYQFQGQSKKISNDQELIQSDPTSCPQNQKGNN